MSRLIFFPLIHKQYNTCSHCKYHDGDYYLSLHKLFLVFFTFSKIMYKLHF